MVKQERAARTREALVRAAAHEFEQTGYEGTSLTRVAGAAGISVGALTFHFSSKAGLAQAVRTRGDAAVRACVAEAGSGTAPALDSVVALTLALARLLEEDEVVRAAVRLWREVPDSDGTWSALWLPAVAEALDRAGRTGLAPAVGGRDVALLAEYLLAGAESRIRGRIHGHASEGEGEREESAEDDGSVERHLSRLWALVLPGLSGH
ncbi:TetR/AcrR family transcriptional regulator [Streptomyces venezuelae]|uniref:TetR/AcrR family transcriptional regulator n=1 Tax=Streptomyces venezuelae TaxID=54571 RepID=A0A5P2BYU8_STRVZ|nr:TetR/AcrR family transcriptional regulator [Streptomyces venezuelae]QES34828.1 TetR/AcrR family transcriptional regulator [Streptomyces venezuelae]